jgi:hypothetical protein
VIFNFLVIDKSDKIKIIKEKFYEIYLIDINSWFKTNNLTPESMNEIRQFIFDEWLNKKIASSRSKIQSGTQPIIICEYITPYFISSLKEKVSFILTPEKCDIILFAE